MSRPLTRREQFAMHAPPMPENLYGHGINDERAQVEWATTYADALIKRLDSHGNGCDCDDCAQAARDALIAANMPEPTPEETAIDRALSVEADRKANATTSGRPVNHLRDCKCPRCKAWRLETS